MKYILSAWMRDKPGVLYRVSGLLRRRNFNIDSLQVSQSEEPGISRMTFVVDGDERMLEQVEKQLIKLVDVTRIENLAQESIVTRELALLRVASPAARRTEILQLVEIFRAQVVDVSSTRILLQIVGNPNKIDAFTQLLDGFDILEMVRTGPVAIKRSAADTAAADGAALNGRVPPNGSVF